jgi:hypothetical protein
MTRGDAIESEKGRLMAPVPRQNESLEDMSLTIFTAEPCLLPTNEPVGSGIAVPEVAIAAASLTLPFDLQTCRPRKPRTRTITTTTPMM